ncbi:MAG: sugar transferase, partial [Gaiellaceae bacterium]
AWRLATVGVDAAMVAAAAVMATLASTRAGPGSLPAAWSIAFGAVVVTIFQLRGLYGWHLHLRLLETLRTVLGATAFAAMAVLSGRALVGGVQAAPEMVRLWVFAVVYLTAGRIALHRWQIQARRQGGLVRPTLILGAGRVGQVVARRLAEHPELGLRPVGFLDKEPLDGDRSAPLLGASWDLDRVVAEHGVTYAIVTFSTAPAQVLLKTIKRCDELGIEVAFVPRLFERMTEKLTIEHLGGLPLISTRRSDPRGWQFRVKYALDRLLAAIALVVTLPVTIGAMVAVAVSLGRPILFRQRRVGRDGRPFDLLKFRSMNGSTDDGVAVVDLPPDTAPGGVEGGDRRTRLGALLRATAIDELPQLINVIRGEMSLVGPRPERPEFVHRFTQTVHRYGDRHRVKAGITGWAQVHGLRGKTSISDRAEWDNYYIENWSLWLDLKILLMTMVTVAAGSRNVE